MYLDPITKKEALTELSNGVINDEIIVWAKKALITYDRNLERKRKNRQKKSYADLVERIGRLDDNTDYTAEAFRTKFFTNPQYAGATLKRAVQSGLMTVRAEIIDNKAVKVYRKI